MYPPPVGSLPQHLLWSITSVLLLYALGPPIGERPCACTNSSQMCIGTGKVAEGADYGDLGEDKIYNIQYFYLHFQNSLFLALQKL